jgi:hypothetical protein
MSWYGSRRNHVQSQMHVYREDRPDSPGSVPSKDPKRPGEGRNNAPHTWTRRPYSTGPGR